MNRREALRRIFGRAVAVAVAPVDALRRVAGLERQNNIYFATIANAVDYYGPFSGARPVHGMLPGCDEDYVYDVARVSDV